MRVFPPPIAVKDLSRLVLPRDEDEVRKIAEYVEWQAKGETVEHAEKVSTEFVIGRKHECWDVRTDRARWWVPAVRRITIRWKLDLILLNPPNHTSSIPAAGVNFATSL